MAGGPGLQSAPFSFIAVGDIPYSTQAEIGFARSIRSMGESSSSFVIHVGDIKARKESCGEETYLRRFQLYDRCALPWVVLVGDNEFNDCPDPQEAIGLFRKYFTPNGTSIGQSRMRLSRQSEADPAHAYPEHCLWVCQGVPFVGLNVVGSANHRSATEEWRARTEAGLAWLERGFAKAEEILAPAVVVAFHANPFGDGKGRTFAEPYAAILESLISHSEAFGKPVLFIHGDSHYFRWDHPFPSRTGTGVEVNLSRLEVFGNPNPHWVEVQVFPDREDVFAVQPHYLRD